MGHPEVVLLQVHGQVFDDVVSVAEVSSLAGDDGVLHLLLQLNVLVIPDRHWRGRFGSSRRRFLTRQTGAYAPTTVVLVRR